MSKSNQDLDTKRINLRVIGIHEGEERRGSEERLVKEIINEHFPDLKREMEALNQEA